MQLLTTLRSRLLVLLLLTVIPVMGLLLHAYSQQREQALMGTQQEAQRLSRLALKDHEALVEGTHQLLIALAHAREIRSARPGECDPFLASLLAHERLYVNFGLIDTHGEIICSAVPMRHRTSAHDRRWFQRALEAQRFIVGDYQRGRITGKQVITFADTLVNDRGGTNIIFAAANLAWLQSLLTAIDLPSGAVALVTEGNGNVLAHYPDSATWIGSWFPATPKEAEAASGADQDSTVTVRGPDGVDRIYATVGLPSATGNLRLMIGLSKQTSLSHANRVLAINLAWLALVILFVFLLAWLGADMLILRGVDGLVRAARELGAGNLRARSGLSSGVLELEKLAQAFDNMADALEHREAQLASSEDRLRLALESSGEGLWDWDLATGRVYYDAKWAEIMGRNPAELAPTFESGITAVHPEDQDAVRQALTSQQTERRSSFEIEYRIRTSSGNTRWIGARGRVIQRDTDGRALRMIGTILDITDRKQTEEELAYLAQYDTLTGLPNRHLFLDRLSHAMIRARRNESMIALMFLDLDDFKDINDTFGHDAGDMLLKAVAKRLQECLRDEDTIGRPGGDEFTIVLENINHIDDVIKIVQKVLSAFAIPFSLNDKEVYSSASIGITLFPLDVDDIDSLVKNADLAMYQAKHQGGNGYRFFSAEMSATSSDRLNLLSHLHRALERDELALEYQPQVDVHTGAIMGVEALLRWNSSELGAVPPAAFIHLAEESGLIIPIGEWVLQCACAQARQWQAEGFGPLRISVNLSSRQLRQKDLLDVIARALGKLDPALLELEVSEASIAQATASAMGTLEGLSSLGVALSIDDFGTGYSSLSALIRLPIKRIKIDQSFVRGITINRSDATIAAATIRLAKSLGLAVTAEGVELTEQLEFLRLQGCDEYQGFRFSAPLTAYALQTPLREDRKNRIPAPFAPD